MAAPRTLQSTILQAFAVLVLLVLVLVFTVFVLSTRRLLFEQAVDSSIALSEAVSRDIDREVESMDLVSINIAYSELVRGSFLQYLENSGQAQLAGRRTLADVVTAIVGPNLPIKQGFLYDFEGRRIGFGMLNFASTVDVDALDWMADVLAADGRKVLTGPEPNEILADAYVNQEEQDNIILRRLFFDRYRNPVGVMEILQDAEDVFSAAIEYLATQEGSVFVMRSDGTLVFGGETLSTSLAEAYAASIQSASIRAAASRTAGETVAAGPHWSGVVDVEPGVIAAYAESTRSGWTTVLRLPGSVLYAEANSVARQLALLGIPILFAVLAVSYFVSRRITRPLASLHTAITNIELVSIGVDGGSDPLPLNELEEVNQAVSRMGHKLKASVQEVLAAHEHEANAKLQALQSQANPHFLHNTINTITAMAEEGQTDQIILLSSNLSAMMRYLADHGSDVSLHDELEYTRRYLECMKIRFETSLTFTVVTSGDPEAVTVPRLIVQPIAENAVKHGTTRRGPWEIRVEAVADDQGWEVTVTDNGPGFSPEVLQRIAETITNPDIADPAGEGIGLTSALARLRLAFGEHAVFGATNQPGGGAQVTLGVRPSSTERES